MTVMISFDDCWTYRDISTRYKELFHAVGIGQNYDHPRYWELANGYREANERLRDEGTVVTTVGPVDPNKIHPRRLRNWAAQQGLPLAKKGRVSRDVENAYREAHDMPLLPVENKVSMKDTTASAAEIRAWARANDIEVAVKGRVHPDVIAAYVAANPTEVS